MCPLSKNSAQKSLAMEIASASISMQISMQFNCAHKHEQAQHKGQKCASTSTGKNLEWFAYHLCFY